MTNETHLFQYMPFCPTQFHLQVGIFLAKKTKYCEYQKERNKKVQSLLKTKRDRQRESDFYNVSNSGKSKIKLLTFE